MLSLPLLPSSFPWVCAPTPIFCGWRSDKFKCCQRLTPKHNYNHTLELGGTFQHPFRYKELTHQGNNFINITSPWSSSSRPGPDPWISHAPSSSSEEPGSAWPTPRTSSPGTGHSLGLWHPCLIWQKCEKPKRELSHGKSPGLASQAGSCCDNLCLYKFRFLFSFLAPLLHTTVFSCLACSFSFLLPSTASLSLRCFICVHAGTADGRLPPSTRFIMLVFPESCSLPTNF